MGLGQPLRFHPRDAAANSLMASHTLVPLSGTFVALFVAEIVIFLIVAALMTAIKDMMGKKERKGLGRGGFILASIISSALFSALLLYYLLATWTIP